MLQPQPPQADMFPNKSAMISDYKFLIFLNPKTYQDLVCRAEQLEEEAGTARQAAEEQNNALCQARQDNVALVEKVRYLQRYVTQQSRNAGGAREGIVRVDGAGVQHTQVTRLVTMSGHCTATCYGSAFFTLLSCHMKCWTSCLPRLNHVH